MTWSEWLSLAAVVLAALTTLSSYLRKAPFVPASQLDEMRQQIAGLRAENTDCRADTDRLRTRIGDLETQVNLLRAAESFWQREYQRLREGAPPR